MERIKEDRPITIKDDKGNLNRCIADIVSVRRPRRGAGFGVVVGGRQPRGGGRTAPTLPLPQLFITVMDKLRLEIRAMDEVGTWPRCFVVTPAFWGGPGVLGWPRRFAAALAHRARRPQIQPDLRELMETMNRMSHLPPDFEGRQKVNQW